MAPPWIQYIEMVETSQMMKDKALSFFLFFSKWPKNKTIKSETLTPKKGIYKLVMGLRDLGTPPCA